MPPKVVVGFETVNKAQIRGRVGHSRTGACTSKGRCHHGMKPVYGAKGRRKAGKK